jgi:protease-4
MNRVMTSVRTVVAGLVLSAGVATAAMHVQPAREGALVRVLEINGAIAERPSPLAWLMSDGEEPTLRMVINSLYEAAADDELSMIVIRLKDAELNSTQVEELGAVLKDVRAMGKKVSVFAEAYGPTELLLGSYADDVIIQNGGPVSLPGLHMEEMFLADTLAWVGVKADMVQVGAYKGASEQMARNSPSPEWDQNITSLLDSMYGNMRSALKEGRKLSDSQLDSAMEKLWMADGKQAQESGVVDSVIDLTGLQEHLEKSLGTDVRWGSNIGESSSSDSMSDMQSNPLALFAKLSEEPPTSPDGPAIAVVHIDGAIVDGDSQEGGLFGGEGSVGSRTIRNSLEDIRDEDNFKGVVIRINSPGGSATASEVIWQGIKRLAEKKPVWVSVGSMAASGGYYCAVAADKIYVTPSSIVGSIGVVGGRMSLDGAYEKLKVKVVSRSRGPRADIFRSTGPWSPAELQLVRSKMTETYDLFTSRVTAGREGIDLGKTAEGRLFTGNVAIDLKMADKVGGLSVAISDMAESLNMDEFEVMDFPGAKSLGEIFEDMLGGFVHAPGVTSQTMIGREFTAAGRAIFGDRAWKQMQSPMEALMQMRDEPVLLTTPSVLIFK